AAATRRDLLSALRALGAEETEVVPVSSVSPPQGIDDLVAALDAHRARLDLPERRTRARRHHALADFAVEHGQRGLRALGGRRPGRRQLRHRAHVRPDRLRAGAGLRARPPALSHARRSARPAAIRRAQAMIVSIGFTFSEVGRTLASATWRPGTSWHSPSGPT